MAYKVEHYDDSFSQHGTLEEAIEEAGKRLEPWRDGKDFIGRQTFDPSEEGGMYAFVCNECCEATDAESYITLVEEKLETLPPADDAWVRANGTTTFGGD